MKLEITSYKDYIQLRYNVYQDLINSGSFSSKLIDPTSGCTLQYVTQNLLEDTLMSRAKELQRIELILDKEILPSQTSKLKKQKKYQLERINKSLEKLSKKIVYSKLAGKYMT